MRRLDKLNLKAVQQVDEEYQAVVAPSEFELKLEEDRLMVLWGTDK